MNKNLVANSGEISLIDLFKIIAKNKIKIAIILIVSIIIATLLSYREFNKPVIFYNQVNLEPGSKLEFIKFSHYNSFLQQQNMYSSSNIETINNESVFNKFIKNLQDADYTINILRNIPYIKKNISQFSKIEQESKLFDIYNDLLTLEYISSNSDKEKLKYGLQINWPKENEGIEILKTLIDLNLEQLQIQIFKELEYILETARELEKKMITLKLQFLREQSKIAKKLNIVDPAITLMPSKDKSNFNGGTFANTDATIYNFFNNDNKYYLYGSKIIDAEIENTSTKSQLDFYNYLKQEVSVLKEDTSIQWIDINLNKDQIDTIKNNKNFLKIWIVTVLLGLILALFYIIYTNTFGSKKFI